MGLLGTNPANAIFGFSKCERIQKEILSLEDKFTGHLSKVKGNYHTNKLWLIDEKIFILTDAAVVAINRAIRLDPLPKIWKLAYNNPKCFTNSQKLRIKELKTMVTTQFISYYEGKQYRNTGKCNGGSIEGYEQRQRDCFIKNVNVLGNYTLYESIYDF